MLIVLNGVAILTAVVTVATIFVAAEAGFFFVFNCQSLSRTVSPAVMYTLSASGSRTSSGAEKCLGELGVAMVVGVGGAMAESADGDAAAAVAGVLVAVVGVEREARLYFSLSLEQSAFKCLDDRMTALSKEERIPDRIMDLSKEERIELVLISGREGWPYRKIAEEFNLRHPYRQPIYFAAVRTLIRTFKETGSVLDKPRSGRPKTSDETKEAVMAKVSASPKKLLRRTSTV
ncbi:Hypothetical predicted protein [Octopus vulgaris]|uniref:Uncharacterized protein n=1 Tax=Octopus vulgaris TaxID=6645 RepID=A0AA36B4L4_OCTVU|nr:Hypothetical predicted protein [Octopus vulgaris]